MQKVDSLVDRARHLSLHPSAEPSSSTLDFHSTVDGHLQQIYETIQGPEGIPRADFLCHVQRETAGNEHEHGDPLASLDAFRAYMKDQGSRARAECEVLDENAPISDYFISSSHNTYLTGNQLYSDAAASAYTSVCDFFCLWALCYAWYLLFSFSGHC